MDKVNTLIEIVNEKLANSQSRTTVLSISAALSLVILYYQTIGKLIKPPKKLRHIPNVNFFKFMMMAAVQREPFGAISRKHTIPLLDAPNVPMYLKPDRLGWTVHIATPEAAKQFFLKTDIYPKADMAAQKGTLFHDFIGPKNIVFASEKEEWKKHRKLVNPAFHKAKPVKTFGYFAHNVLKVLDAANEEPVNITLLMERYTLDVIGQAGFGYDFDSILNEDNDLVKVYNGVKSGLANPMHFLLPWLDQYFLWLLPDRRHKHKLVGQFHGLLNDVIEKKRKTLQLKYQGGNQFDDDEDKDLLTLMLEGEFTGEGVLTNEEIKSNLNVFFLAGHDTTANALSFAIHALARDPTIQQKAREEAIRVLGDEPYDVLPTLEDIKQFDYINQVIKETLRLNGPATAGLTRVVSKDTELSGVYLPKNTPVVVSIYDLHHNPRVWNDPETFDPSRFAAGGDADQKAGGGSGGSMAWSPFYNGQRMCIGMQFSLEEQRVMLSCLLRKYEWRLPENSIHKDEVITETMGILTAKNLEVIFKRRY